MFLGEMKMVVYILETGFYPIVEAVFSEYYLASEFALNPDNHIGKDYKITEWVVK